MPKSDCIETEGVVTEVLRNAKFKVRLTNGHIIDAYISGKLRMNYIKILEGDQVKLEMSPYDLTKGRIFIIHIHHISDDTKERKEYYYATLQTVCGTKSH